MPSRRHSAASTTGVDNTVCSRHYPQLRRGTCCKNERTDAFGIASSHDSWDYGLGGGLTLLFVPVCHPLDVQSSQHIELAFN